MVNSLYIMLTFFTLNNIYLIYSKKGFCLLMAKAFLVGNNK